MAANPYLIETPARIAFSGGRTSGYLLYHIREAFGGELPDDVYVTFANTGRETEETLEFVRDCQVNWNVNVRWIEYSRDVSKPVVKPDAGQRKIGCHGFREVTFDTASRNGEPFRAIIEVKAAFRAEAKEEPPVLPNPTDRWCSGELKHRTMERFMRSLDVDEYLTVVGIRADEEKRAVSLYKNKTGKIDYICPLIAAKVTQDDVQRFWKRQPFDLKLPHDPELGTYEGNCDLCFLKAKKKIARLQQERPEAFDWWAEMEDITGQTFRRDRPSYRQMADQRVALQMCETPGADVDDSPCMCTE